MKLDLKEWIAKITDHFCCDLLYSGSFSSGTITLSKSVANYKRLIVVYSDNDGSKFTKEVIHDKAATFPFVCESIRPTGVLYVKAMIVNASGTSMTMAYNRQSAGGGTPASGTYITISKIYGCTSIVGGVLLNSIFKAFSDFMSLLKMGGGVNAGCQKTNSENTAPADTLRSVQRQSKRRLQQLKNNRNILHTRCYDSEQACFKRKLCVYPCAVLRWCYGHSNRYRLLRFDVLKSLRRLSTYLGYLESTLNTSGRGWAV